MQNINKLTPTEVYNRIKYVTSMAALIRSIHPDSIVTGEKASRIGNIQAIKNTWYYYNNQDEFNKLPLIDFYFGDKSK